jgi:hypothetical protein
MKTGFKAEDRDLNDFEWGCRIMLSRLRKLAFKIRHKNSAGRFAESMRRVNRLARLMAIIHQRSRRKVGADDAGCSG